MITKQSMELKNFYLAYQQWVQRGSPREASKNSFGFTRRDGLCENLDSMYSKSLGRGAICELTDELTDQFAAMGLPRGYPFGMDDYSLRYAEHTMDECPKRLEWVDMMCGVAGVV